MTYQTGALTARVNDSPQKVNGLAGLSLSRYAFSWIYCIFPIQIL